jgi:hypothetical protein
MIVSRDNFVAITRSLREQHDRQISAEAFVQLIISVGGGFVEVGGVCGVVEGCRVE